MQPMTEIEANNAANIPVSIEGLGPINGRNSIVILGPNGSGKTTLAKAIANHQQVSGISAQRRTWINDSLPVSEESNLRNQVHQQTENWKSRSWQQSEEIDTVLSLLVGEHFSKLTAANEKAIENNAPVAPTTDTKLARIQAMWERLFPGKHLILSNYFPRVQTDSGSQYSLRDMSDGERSALYMAARVLSAEAKIILVDEPELHMHSRFAVRFWDEAEQLRPDCRFVYITHDLAFTLSRAKPIVITIQAGKTLKIVPLNEVSSEIARDVLGAATLPFYARRIFIYEGESSSGLARDFFSVWFDGPETFAIPGGGRDSVCAAISGLKTVGLTSAELVGLVDRDFYPDSILENTTEGVDVLAIHEVESLFCAPEVVSAVAHHLGKEPSEVLSGFVDQIKSTFVGKTLHQIVARRSRARVGDLFDGAFDTKNLDNDFGVSVANYRASMDALDFPGKTSEIFHEEYDRLVIAIGSGNFSEILQLLPGKHLLSLLTRHLGLSSSDELTDLCLKSLNRQHLKEGDSLKFLGANLEAALLNFLPART